MSDFITLSCPSCGGRLDITADVERFACAHCGNEQIVRRGGEIVSLEPVVAGLKQVQTGVDKTASELGIKRLQAELYGLQAEWQRAVAELSLRLQSITARLDNNVSDYQASKDAEQLQKGCIVILTVIFSGMCLLGIAVELIGQLTDGGSNWLTNAVIFDLVVLVVFGAVFVFFRWLFLTLGRPDIEAELRLAQARRDANEQTSSVRSRAEEAIRLLDAKISKVHQELERHRQIVSQ